MVHDRASNARRVGPPGWATVTLATWIGVPKADVTAPVSVFTKAPVGSVIAFSSTAWSSAGARPFDGAKL